MLISSWVISIPSYATTASVPYNFVPNTVIQSGQMNGNFNTLVNFLNGTSGGIDNTNILSGANIAISKLNPNSILFILMATSNNTLASGITGDTVPRMTMTSDGWLAAGPGSASVLDTMMRRTSAGVWALRNFLNTTDAGLTCGTLNASSTVTFTVPLSAGNGGVGSSTLPTSGQIPVGNAGGTAYAPVSMSNDATLASTGALTLATVNSNTGTFSSPSSVTVNGKGLITAIAAGGGGGFGGSGADGAIALVGTTGYTAPIQKNATTFSLTGANTLTLTSAPTVINCTGTFTLGDASNASTITNTAGAGGVGGAIGPYYGSAATGGGSGSGPGAGQGFNAYSGGGGGGFGAAGGAAGGGNLPYQAGNNGQPYQCWINGGSGGGGGADSNSASGTAGVGGNGGGAIIVCAGGAINCKTVSVINNNGTAGGNATTSGCGGGGGSGGLVFLASQASTTVTGTISVVGGNGGAGAGATDSGGGGGGGGGRIVLWAPTITTTSSTLTMTGGTGGSATGTGNNGTNGGTSTSQSITGTPNLPILTWFFDKKGANVLETLTAIKLMKDDYRYIGKTKSVEVKQSDLAWFAAGNDISQFAYYNMGDMQGTTCVLVGDYVEANYAS